MTVFTGSPALNRIIVGIESTWYLAAVCWFSSTFSFTTRSSGRSEAISSSTGATTRHGPHHGAQKSTSTGLPDSMTSAWKLLSVTSVRLPAIGVSLIACLPLYKVKELLRRAGELSAHHDREAFPRAHDRRLYVRERREEVGRDVHLDERGDDQHRDRDGDGHERRREQLLPLAATARDDPRRERQEERHELGGRVGQDPEQQGRGRDAQKRRDSPERAPEQVRLGAQRERRRGRDETDCDAPTVFVDPSRESRPLLRLERQRGSRDEPRDARHRVQREHEPVVLEDARDVRAVADREGRT